MIGANAVAAEFAVQLLDVFDVSKWTFRGETLSVGSGGTVVRVIVTPPGLPGGTGYYVIVTINEDQKLSDQLAAGVAALKQLLTTAAPYATGQTPDAALDGFFASLGLPSRVSAELEKQEQTKRHPPAGTSPAA